MPSGDAEPDEPNHSAAGQCRPSSTPMKVATPLPPWKRSQTGIDVAQKRAERRRYGEVKASKAA